MMRIGLSVFLIVGMTVVASCSKSTESAESMKGVGYQLFDLEEAGWKSKFMTTYINGLAYKVTQVPIQYYILKNQTNRDFKEVDSIYQSNKNERIIEVEFQHATEDDLLKNKYTNRDYASAVKYAAFEINKDFKVVTQSGDTVECAGSTFERNFKLAPFKRLLLHFSDVPEEENIQLVYNDQLFGNGLLKFMFTEEPIRL